MVRALLRHPTQFPKTVTRRQQGLREININPDAWVLSGWARVDGSDFARFDTKENMGQKVRIIRCPFGIPGDQLWVKETWGPADGRVCYRADQIYAEAKPDGGKWKSAMFMPKRASRITLERTEARAPERLQAITREDARAEGITEDGTELTGQPWYPGEQIWRNSTSVENFRRLYESIHGAQAWEHNPWLWPISFKLINPVPTEGVP